MRQIDTSTTFHPKAYLQLALLAVVGMALLPVRGLIVPHLGTDDAPIVDWVLRGVLAIMALAAFATIRRHWLTYSLQADNLVVQHKILRTRCIPLQQIQVARLVETQGGRGHTYTSIELQLQNGEFVLLDGLYNRGMGELCDALASRLP